mgnify:CR=1 FL=1
MKRADALRLYTYVDCGDSFEFSVLLYESWSLRLKGLLNTGARQFKRRTVCCRRCATIVVTALELPSLLKATIWTITSAFRLIVRALVRSGHSAVVIIWLLGTGCRLIFILVLGELGAICCHTCGIDGAWVILSPLSGNVYSLTSIIEPWVKHHLSWFFRAVASGLVLV